VAGTRVWTPQEDKLARTPPIVEVVKRPGRSKAAVMIRRRQLGVPDYRRQG
jgi:hypothetical protein